MYHNIASSIRSKLSPRGSSSSLITSFVALPLSYTTPTTTRMAIAVQSSYYAPTHQATLSLSMFATVGSASGSDGTSSSSNEQRRPFWATRPMEDESTKTPTPSVNTIDHSVNAAAASVGISMEDIKKAAAKAKKGDTPEAAKEPKKAAAKKKKAEKEEVVEEEEEEEEEEVIVDDEGDVDLPPDQDSITTTYMSKVIAAKHKGVTSVLAKRIVDDIFDMVIDGVVEKKEVRIPRLGIFTKSIQKAKIMTKIQTKEKYSVPAKYRVAFKVSSVLRKKVTELELPADAK